MRHLPRRCPTLEHPPRPEIRIPRQWTLPYRGAVSALLAIACLILLVSCATNPAADPKHLAETMKLQGVTLNDPISPVPHDGPIVLTSAKNEWTDFTIQVSGLLPSTDKTRYVLRIHPLQSTSDNAAIAPANYSAYQVLPMPVDVNRAGFVRHTGLFAQDQRVPRALLPAPIDNGAINLSALRSPADPTNPQSRAGSSAGDTVLLWVDIHVPPETAPGEYAARCDLLVTGSDRPIATVPLKMTVHDFVLSDERHLVMVSQLEWRDLERLYPERFEAVTPRLMNRNDPRYGDALRTLDQIVTLAQQHRAQVVIPKIQPIVKWPAGKPPQVDWENFDSIVMPWMKGEVFADKTPVQFWPLPEIDFLGNYPQESQLAYWVNAAMHFNQYGWLGRSPVFLEKRTPGRVTAAESIQLSNEAAQVLAVHPDVRVLSPLEEDQVQFTSPNNPALIRPETTERLQVAAKSLVFAPPIQSWPSDVARPQRWLRTDLPGLLPYIGAGGDERDVRLWAWLAYLRDANLILWDGTLPKTTKPSQPADPNQVVWFYPGQWFGVDEPIPTIQLKWLRRAQQDFEYLYLARQRGERLNAVVMARLITKPVEIQPHQAPDPTYALMCGTTDPAAWADAQRLLARTILLQEPGREVDPARRHELNLQTLQWIQPQERPYLMGRTTSWLWDRLNQHGGNWIDLRVGIDIYNASDSTPDQNLLQWTFVPPAWQVQPQPTAIPALRTYQVQRFNMDAKVNLDEVQGVRHRPVEITFTHGFTQRTSPLRLLLPVAKSERREGNAPKFDGSLEDWDAADAIQDGPLVRMLNRPALQRHDLQFATTPSQIYTSWANQNFYLAFKLGGVSAVDARSTRNFVDYQLGRAWGEDLAEVLIQPIYVDNTVGPVLHVVCKPSGHWVERKLDPKTHADPWQPFEGTGIRYASTIDAGEWRGEVSIPWDALIDRERGIPRLLRFNFSQHRTATGESATWAGPVDFGKDDSFMGLIHLREADTPGMGYAR